MADNGSKTPAEMAEEKVFEGCTITLGELQRQDGQIAEAIDKSRIQSLGVIQTVITAVEDDKNYRQILKRALWKNTEEMDKAVNAIAECDATGAVKMKRIILDRITTHSAGINGELIHEALEALTHTTFTTNVENTKRWKRDHDRDKSSSPLS